MPLAVLFVCVVLVAESCPLGVPERRCLCPAAHCLPAHGPVSCWEVSGSWCMPMVAVLELLSPGTSVPAQGGDAPRASAQGAASSTVERWQRGQAQLVAPWSRESGS